MKNSSTRQNTLLATMRLSFWRPPPRVAENNNNNNKAAGPWHANMLRRAPRGDDATVYWRKWIQPNLSPYQMGLLAEYLFSFIWNTVGPKIAMNQVLDPKQQLDLAIVHFDRGCSLWTQRYFKAALPELEKSLHIQESLQSWHDDEIEVKLHYSIGIVYRDLKQYEHAMKKFLQSWRLSGLRLGMSHPLTQASQCMMEEMFTHQERYCGILMERNHRLKVIQNALAYEKEGDSNCASGAYEKSVSNYQESLEEYQRQQHYGDRTRFGWNDPFLEILAAVHSKLATALEAQNCRLLASDEWATALSLYQQTLGDHHPVTIDTMTKLLANHGQKTHTGPNNHLCYSDDDIC